MVKVRENYPLTATGKVELNQWAEHIASVARLPKGSEIQLQKAANSAYVASQHSQPTDSSFLTGLEMASILAEFRLDEDALIAAIIYPSISENNSTTHAMADVCSEGVTKLIEGVSRMAAISNLRNDSGNEVFGKASHEQTTNVRKMLVAIVDDVRVALIKLAERICAIRTAKSMDKPKRHEVAKEVADIYAPLANRLGIGHIKWELEDLSFRYLHPKAYKKIAKLLDEKRIDRQNYISKVIGAIKTQVDKHNIQAEISGRAKHIYSIWKKMQKKGVGFSEVYDIRAVRVLVSTTKDCYEMLGIVHHLWRNIPDEFDDYIAARKENGYQSLHTAVFGPDNKILEIQIRTYAMHEEAEFGVCAHWLYKDHNKKQEGNATSDGYEQKISWLRQLLEWHEELGVNVLTEGWLDSVENKRVYVFTPDGHVVDLPDRSTPLDFAYRIHTEIGHCCRGAKINGRIVPLNYILKTADQVEILTGKQKVPSRDWLIEALGYINTSRARAKVRQWFGEQAREQNIADGRALLDQEFKRLAFSGLKLEEIVSALKLQSLDDLYAAVGSSELGIGQVINAAQKIFTKDKHTESVISLTKKAPLMTISDDIYIEGVGNLLTTIATCCNPLPGENIVGFITLGKGVSIHRQDCSNILQLQTDKPERIMQVSWGEAPKELYSAKLIINAFDRTGLLKDIVTMLDNDRININAMQTRSDKANHSVEMEVAIEIRNFTELSRVLARLNQLPNIESARRKQ